MRVGLNLVYLTPGEQGGMEIYARELIPALLAERPELRLTAFVNREAAQEHGAPWGELVPAVTIPVDARNRVEWVRGEQQLLPPAAKRAGVDIVHSLASTAPLWGSFKRVTTIHDLIYHHYPDAHFGIKSLGMRVLSPAAAKRSHRVIAISESTKRDVVNVMKIPPERVDVALNGFGHSAHADPKPEAELRRELDAGDRPIVLSVSAKRPHKNLMRLLDAHELLPAATRPLLVIPGYPTEYEDELKAHAARLGIDRDVRWLGWVDDATLEGLYAAATCFVFPSLFEGFGFPILEAMGRGLPVATSDRASLPEVAGDAALIFNPESPQSIAEAVTRLLSDGDLRSDLKQRGLKRVTEFSWQRCAQAVLRSYAKVSA